MSARACLLLLVVACVVVAIHGEEESKTKETPVSILPVKEHSADSGSSTTAKSENGDAPCTKIHDPVCGSDGKTYNSNCEFQNAQKKDSKLTLAKEGEC